MTKERFLRSITSPTPTFIEASENSALEAVLATEKATLKAQKASVAETLSALEARGRALAARHTAAQLRAAHLHTLPAHIAALEAQLAALAAAHPPEPQSPANPHLRLGLADTAALLAARDADRAALDARIAAVGAALPRRERERERVEAELGPLRERKAVAVGQALEARRRREEGGVDGLEEKGRWFRASGMALESMLGVEG